MRAVFEDGGNGEESIFVLLTAKSRGRPRPTWRASPGRSSVGCLGDRTTLAFVAGPATGSLAPGSKMSCRSPRNVILAKWERAPFATNYKRLPIGPGYRSVGRSDRGPSTVSLRVFTVREGEGS